MEIINYLLKNKYYKLAKLLYKIPKSLKEFHINDKYIVIDGEFKGHKFGDVVRKCTTLCMLYVEDNPDGSLKNIDFEIIK